jgi:hypothetical protein
MFTIQSVTNLKWVDVEKTAFTCNVKYAEFNEVHPTGVNATDPYAHIQELWEKGNAGEYGEIEVFVPFIPPQATQPQPSVEGAQNL